jgi:hypothetical protein
MFDLFEHIEAHKAIRLATLAYTVLSSDGALVIRTPNMANILGIYSKYIDITHYQCYTEFSMLQVLLEAGFKKENIKFLSPRWNPKTKHFRYKKINDFLHKKLFQIQDRVTPQFFDKNLLVTAIKRI